MACEKKGAQIWCAYLSPVWISLQVTWLRRHLFKIEMSYRFDIINRPLIGKNITVNTLSTTTIKKALKMHM